MEVIQMASLPILEGEPGHTPSVAAGEAGSSVVLCSHVPSCKSSILLL